MPVGHKCKEQSAELCSQCASSQMALVNNSDKHDMLQHKHVISSHVLDSTAIRWPGRPSMAVQQMEWTTEWTVQADHPVVCMPSVLPLCAPADGIVTSDGSSNLPYCSWGLDTGCPGPWEEVKQKCAAALCQLNNYTTGVWLADSGDMCTTKLPGTRQLSTQP
jgi:hypothetical protein